MRKAILPLLIIITMVLATSVATARDFKATGAVNSANGWSTTGAWENDIVNGERVASYTNSPAMVTASHPVVTGASGQFGYSVLFKINDAANYVKAGLVAGGHEYAIEYKNGKFWFDGRELGTNTNALTNNNLAQIWSDDGKVWHGKIYGLQADVTVNAVPTAATLAVTNKYADNSPVIYGINFNSVGEPAVTPAATGSEPMYDSQQVQNFYDNVYPLIGSPYDTVTRNADGTYTVTKGYPTSETHDVAGTVTSAADGSPITSASVLLGNSLQKTDSAGKFKFDGIANGAAEIAVSADGFASKTQTINVNADMLQNFALDKVATDGSTTASAANETGNVTTNTTITNTTVTNTTMTPTMAPTTAPLPTQTQSPGFEGIAAAIAMIGSAGVLVYLNRKR